MSSISLEEKSLRLRYEAFSNLANEVNKAENWEEVGKAITAHLKFMIDFFAFRFSYNQNINRITYQIFRGTYQYWLNLVDEITPLEADCSYRGIPVKFDKNEINGISNFQNTLFANERINQIFVLPLSFHTNENAILIAANKNLIEYSEIDFRFFRLVAELLATKISQIFLADMLAKKNQELAEANEEINTLFYRTSHDFRRPLTSILGLVKLAQMSVKEEMALELFKKIADTVQELERMLIKLQSISTSEEVDIAEEIDFQKIIDLVKHKFTHLLSEKNIRFEYVNNGEQSFYSNYTDLLVIIENLIENAIHFSSQKDPFIRVSISISNKYALIEVEDNGQGIEENLKKNIFDMYFRANENSKGNGLGLYVVRKLVQKLYGKIHLESEINKGSKFAILLPH
jgi:signal transduction histidine kinase